VTEIAIQFTPRRTRFSETMARYHAQYADCGFSGRGNFAAFLSKRPRAAEFCAAGVDGFQLRLELRRTVADGVRNLLLDAMVGDATLYSGRTWWRRAGRLWSPSLQVWTRTSLTFPNYAGGDLGAPRPADRKCWRAERAQLRKHERTIHPETGFRELSDPVGVAWEGSGSGPAIGVLACLALTLMAWRTKRMIRATCGPLWQR